jgi:hypothetical protein
MNKQLTRAAFLFTLVLSRIAVADYVSSSGVECAHNSESGWMFSNDNYVKNISYSSTVKLVCPVNLGARLTMDTDLSQVIVRYVDYSPTNYFSCKVVRVNNAGVRSEGALKYTCATAGGCPLRDTSYTGVGYLLLSLPSPTIYVDDSITVQCTVPVRQIGYDGSGIISYHAQ